MQQAGLVTRQEAPEAHDGKSRPYFITDKGRQYLEEARQKAMLLEPSQRQGWAEGVGIDTQRALTQFIRGLPEFRGSDESRIQEVTGQLQQLTERLSQATGQQRFKSPPCPARFNP